MIPRFILACCFTVLMTCCSSPVFAGRMELTTYYPAPVGEYTNLNSTQDSNFATDPAGNVGIGITPAANSLLGKLQIHKPNPAVGAADFDYQTLFRADNDSFRIAGVSGFGAGGNRAALVLTTTVDTLTDPYLAIQFDNSRGVLNSTDPNRSAWNIGVDNAREFFIDDVGCIQRRLVINRFGNVGIGTLTANTRLEVMGPDLNNTSSRQVYVMSSDANSGRLEIGYRYDAGVADYARLQAWTNAGAGSGRPLIINDAGGNVGIGMTNPGFTLDINGTARCNASAWSSDLRWKENIATIDNSLEKILRLRGVEFDWRRNEFKDKNFQEGRQIGMIAQELEKEFPELVMEDGGGYKSIAYDKLTAVLVEAIKEQQQQIDLLKKEVAQLQQKK